MTGSGGARGTVRHEAAYRDSSDEWQGRWTGHFLWRHEHTEEEGQCVIDLSGTATVKRGQLGSSVLYRGEVRGYDVEIDIDVTAGRRSN